MEGWYLVPPDIKILEREEGSGTRERNELHFPWLTLE